MVVISSHLSSQIDVRSYVNGLYNLFNVCLLVCRRITALTRECKCVPFIRRRRIFKEIMQSQFGYCGKCGYRE